MLRFLSTFILFIAIYHVFTTILGYGVMGGEHIQKLLALKEIIRGTAIIIFAASNAQYLKKYFSQRKNAWIVFGILLIYSILISLIAGKSGYNMLIGIKYNFHFIAIFLSSTLVGHLLFQREKGCKEGSPAKVGENKGDLKKTKTTHSLLSITNWKKIILYSQYFLIFFVFVGLVVQGLKFIYPDLFQFIGFGPVGDFSFGQKPPVYYRTGPGGTPRLQGLFAGPNNYGYFLVAFLPIIFLRRKNKHKHRKEIFLLSPKKLLNIFFLLLWFSTIILTLSRSAFVGTAIAIIFIYKNRIKKNKIISILIAIIAIGGLTIFSLQNKKIGSTKEHLVNKISGIQNVINKPLGHGLGTAGPAIHHGGSLLPENYYLQVAADIGTIGFIIWVLLIFQFIWIFKNIETQFQKNNTGKNESIFLHRKYLSIGRSCLLIMGLFLHVFEDSMVNYLFFIPYGILTGYLSALTPKHNKIFSLTELKKIKDSK